MINILYIAGAGRSGSTLLERILGQIDVCVAVGEFRHLWRIAPSQQQCGCGKPLDQCDFWREVLARVNVEPNNEAFRSIYEAQQQVDRLRYIPQMISSVPAGRIFKQRQQNYTDTLRQMYLAIHELTDASVIVEASKDVSTLYLLSAMEDVCIRVLHLVRDSRAVAYSWTREKVLLHRVEKDSYMPRYSPQYSAGDWMYRNILTELAHSRADGYRRLRYKDLLAHPRETIESIARFIQLPSADLGFIEGNELKFSRVSHTIAGNPSLLEQGPVQLRFDNIWQQEMKKTDQVTVATLTWPLLKRYGYL